MATKEKKSLKKRLLSNGPSLGSKLVMGVFITTVALVGIAVASTLYANVRSGSQVNEDGYQAVFLQNGQVYFGRLSSIDQEYVKLTDVYYLQTSQDVQGKDSKKADDKENQPQLQLNKLGNELHGPQSQMYIVKENISFWENLKSDSKVVEAIQNQNKD